MTPKHNDAKPPFCASGIRAGDGLSGTSRGRFTGSGLETFEGPFVLWGMRLARGWGPQFLLYMGPHEGQCGLLQSAAAMFPGEGMRGRSSVCFHDPALALRYAQLHHTLLITRGSPDPVY